MKIVFFGLNQYGEAHLMELIDKRYNVILVVVPQQNRTKKIYSICKKENIPLFSYDGKKNKLINQLKEIKPELIVVASFPYILPKEIINLPKFGAINIHPSLLPKYRGAHPVQWAIINDERHTGVTIHYLSEKIDAGDIIYQQAVTVINEDNILSLLSKIITIGKQLMVKTILKIEQENKKIKGKKQKIYKQQYFPKRQPEDSHIDWKKNSREIFNLIRSSQGVYSAYFNNEKGRKINVLKSYLSNRKGKVLAKIDGYYLITSDDGVIMIKINESLRIGDILS